MSYSSNCDTQKTFIKWLTLEECKKIHKVFEDLGGLKNIIVAVDRTHIFMKNISNKDPEVYFTRKKCYAIHCQGIVNDKGIFTSFDIVNNYLLGDSAYPISSFLIPLFKDPNS
ncbi:14298_t:CDS:2 [Funneliformis geosporum]|nr:14298_t:CDS:2 [Funneliformis geosporum]